MLRRFEQIAKTVLFAILLVWVWGLFQVAKQFPSLFEAETINLVVNQWIISIFLILIISIFLKFKKIKFIDENKNGILISIVFFSIYFYWFPF